MVVPLDSKVVSALTAAAPDLLPTTIRPERYKHLGAPVSTVGRPVVLITSEDIDAEVVYRLVKVVFDGMERFKRIHPALRRLEPESMLRDGLATPLHEGARKYVLESGLM